MCVATNRLVYSSVRILPPLQLSHALPHSFLPLGLYATEVLWSLDPLAVCNLLRRLICLSHCSHTLSMLLLLCICLTLLGQFPHCINESKMFLGPATLNAYAGSWPSSWGWLSIWTSLLLHLLGLSHNIAVSCLDAKGVSSEVMRFNHISWQAFKMDPTLEAFPRSSAFSARGVQGLALEHA